MPKKTVYYNVNNLTEVEVGIMEVINVWGHNKKTPIPLKYVMEKMKELKVLPATVSKALGSLLRKGYIRRAIVISNKTYFVQLRSLN